MNRLTVSTESKLKPDPVIEPFKQHVDVTLIRKNLRLSVEQRIDNLAKLQEFAAELRKAGREETAPS